MPSRNSQTKKNRQTEGKAFEARRTSKKSKIKKELKAAQNYKIGAVSKPRRMRSAHPTSIWIPLRL